MKNETIKFPNELLLQLGDKRIKDMSLKEFLEEITSAIAHCDLLIDDELGFCEPDKTKIKNYERQKQELLKFYRYFMEVAQ